MLCSARAVSVTAAAHVQAMDSEGRKGGLPRAWWEASVRERCGEGMRQTGATTVRNGGNKLPSFTGKNAGGAAEVDA